MRRHAKQRVALVLAVAVALGVVVMWGFHSLNVRIAAFTMPSQPVHDPRAAIWDHLPSAMEVQSMDTETYKRTAFVYICSGVKCRVPLLRASINALRGVGLWCGPVFVVTQDNRLVLQHDEDPSLFGHAVELVHDTHSVKTQRVNSAKLSKTWLLDLIPSNFTTLVYTDVDTVAYGPVFRILDECPQPDRQWCLFPDIPCSDCNTLNTGIMVLHRTPAVSECMSHWRTQISVQYTARDQDALERVEHQKCGVEIHRMSPNHVRYVGQTPFKDIFELRYTSQPLFVHYIGAKYGLYWKDIQEMLVERYSALVTCSDV
eukprot:m.18198 g.18198  ORF g.18198 m.18198 type:complete len:316 (-) comp7716_c0_seq1:62-1009(-)